MRTIWPDLIVPLLALLLAFPVAHALDVKGRIAFNTLLPNSTFMAPGSRVILDHGAQTAYITSEGRFDLTNVKEGKHILEGIIHGYIVEALLLNVNDTVHVQQYHPVRIPLPTSVPSLPYPIMLRPVIREEYYVPSPGLNNLLGMLKSPMVLMMIFSGVMMFGLPKLTAMMDDPEIQAEVNSARKSMGMQNMDFVGSTLSNALTEGESAGAAVAGSGASRASTPGKGNGGKGQKRKGK